MDSCRVIELNFWTIIVIISNWNFNEDYDGYTIDCKCIIKLLNKDMVI